MQATSTANKYRRASIRASVRASVGNIEISLDDFNKVRSASLTKPEEDLLKVISDSCRRASDGEVRRAMELSAPSSYEEDKPSVRRQLRKAIVSKQFLLTPKEHAFLESLASTPEISDSAIRASVEVLETDKLYAWEGSNDDDDSESAAEEDDDASRLRRESILSYRRQSMNQQNGEPTHREAEQTKQHCDPSFRVELWSTAQEKAKKHSHTKEKALLLPPDEENANDDERQSAHAFHNSFGTLTLRRLTEATDEESLDGSSSPVDDDLGFMDLGFLDGEGDGDDLAKGGSSGQSSGIFSSNFAERIGSLGKLFTSPCSQDLSLSSHEAKYLREEESARESEDIEHSFTILGTSAHDIAARPHVMSPPLMYSLLLHMPHAIREENFWLKYSLVRDGASMDTLLNNVRNSVRTLIAIETTDGEIVGVFTSSPWRSNGNHYYGSCESFLWRVRQSRLTPCGTAADQAQLESDVEIFKWSGENRNIQLSNPRKLIVGGGEPHERKEGEASLDYGFGFALNADLSSGTSGPCVTFGSPSLPKMAKDVFEVSNLEVWTMTPVNTVDEAENLELARQFVLDHSNLLQKA